MPFALYRYQADNINYTLEINKKALVAAGENEFPYANESRWIFLYLSP